MTNKLRRYLKLSILVYYTSHISEGSKMNFFGKTGELENLSDTERLQLLANLIIDILNEEQLLESEPH